MDGFDETKDYRTLHLEWIKANRGFRPKSAYPLEYSSYYDYMVSLYSITLKQQKTAFLFLKDDYNWSKKSKTVNNEVATMFGDSVNKNEDTWFITFNFNKDKFKPLDAIKAVQRLYIKDYVVEAYGVFEYHTENGAHPHFMTKLKLNKYNKKGKILDKMAESSLAKFCDGKNFIDIKQFLPCHQDYLELDKATEKKKYLEDDIIWRKENNIPEYLEKKISI